MYGTDGKLTIAGHGYAVCRTKYNYNDYVVTELLYGKEFESIEDEGCSKRSKKLDNRGNVTETRHYAADGSIKNLSSGYAISTASYDNRNNCTYEYYYSSELDADRYYIESRIEAGYSRIYRVFDNANHPIQVGYYLKDWNFVINRQKGYAYVRLSYDNRGKRSDDRYPWLRICQ